MCKYCDYESNDCEIFQDPLDNTWYLDYETGEWDDYNDGFIYDKINISYCPWCGRSLEDKVDFLDDKTPVFRFTTEHTIEEVNIMHKSLLEKYQNLIVLPQDCDINWMTMETFENWVKITRNKIKENLNEEIMV